MPAIFKVLVQVIYFQLRVVTINSMNVAYLNMLYDCAK